MPLSASIHRTIKFNDICLEYLKRILDDGSRSKNQYIENNEF